MRDWRAETAIVLGWRLNSLLLTWQRRLVANRLRRHLLQQLVADAIGMSAVLEVIQERALGLEVAGFSCLTNLAAGISTAKLSHDEVQAIGKRAAADFTRLLRGFFLGFQKR